MDSKDTIKKQWKWTNEPGTISWRRYKTITGQDIAEPGSHVHIMPDPYTQPLVPASNAIPHVKPLRDLVREEVDKAVAHLVAEIDDLTQRCEELEIELECERNSFNRYIEEGPLNPILRGKY
jgi:hypothetical protein